MGICRLTLCALSDRAYRIRSKYGDKIGSVFPEVIASTVTLKPKDYML